MDAIDEFYNYLYSRKPTAPSAFTVHDIAKGAVTELDRYIRVILMTEEQRMSPAEWQARRKDLSATLGEGFTKRFIGTI